jgi:hypothetical protein
MACLNERDSKWTIIYSDMGDDNRWYWYIRLVPGFIDLEAAGFPHGLSIGGSRFYYERGTEMEEWKKAAVLADAIDKFMEVMVEATGLSN